MNAFISFEPGIVLGGLHILPDGRVYYPILGENGKTVLGETLIGHIMKRDYTWVGNTDIVEEHGAMLVVLETDESGTVQFGKKHLTHFTDAMKALTEDDFRYLLDRIEGLEKSLDEWEDGMNSSH